MDSPEIFILQDASDINTRALTLTVCKLYVAFTLCYIVFHIEFVFINAVCGNIIISVKLDYLD